MQGALVIRTLGIFLLLFSTALLPPLGISLIYRDGEADHLGLFLLITLGLGLALWLPTIRVREVLRNRDAFVIVLGKQVGIELQRLVHPSHVKPLKVGRQTIPPRTVEAVWAFFGVYVGVFALFMLLMMGEGLDQVSAFGAVATCMNNVGPGLGEVSANFASVSDAVKWLAAAAMLLGRLEIFTLLVLFTPGFWRD